jgi:hypothetical protein
MKKEEHSNAGNENESDIVTKEQKFTYSCEMGI